MGGIDFDHDLAVHVGRFVAGLTRLEPLDDWLAAHVPLVRSRPSDVQALFDDVWSVSVDVMDGDLSEDAARARARNAFHRFVGLSNALLLVGSTAPSVIEREESTFTLAPRGLELAGI